LRKFTVEKRDVERMEIRDQQRAHTRERTDAAVEKLQSGGRLTFDEFILAQRQVTDDKKKSQKSRKRSKKVEAEVPAEEVNEPQAEPVPEPEVVKEPAPAAETEETETVPEEKVEDVAKE
ncbi:MAG: hypothetical protein ACXABX_06295, partial [Candidatus Thorarchaeota archaeon]